MEFESPEENLPKLEKVDEDHLELLCDEDMGILDEEEGVETIVPDGDGGTGPGEDYEQEEPRVCVLEAGIKTCKDRLDAHSQELKLLFVEINIISNFIKEQFGVELIDKASQIRKHIHDFDEIEELTKALSVNVENVRRSNRRANVKWKTEQERRERLLRKKIRFMKDDDSDTFNSEGENEDSINLGRGRRETVNHPEEAQVHENFKEKDVSQNTKQRSGRGRLVKRINYLELEGISTKKANAEANRVLKRQEKIAQNNENNLECEIKPDPDVSECSIDSKGTKKQVRKSPNQDLTALQSSSTSPIRKRGRPRKAPEEKVTPVSERNPMQCAECGKILKGPGSLKSHMLMHADIRPYPCQEAGCGKRFRVKNKLKLHMLLHTGDKKESCRFCGRLFYFAKDLARHERTHTGEKPFRCNFETCNKSFNVKQHLTLHLRTHTGERPYQCPTCFKKFSQANSLRIHKKIHLKALVAASTGQLPIPKKHRPSGAKTNNTRVKQEGSNHILHVQTGNGEFSDENIVTVVMPTGTTINPSHVIKIRQAETSHHAQSPQNSQDEEDNDDEDQGLITVDSQDQIESDQEWKLNVAEEDGVSSSHGTVSFPIYGFAVQNRLPVIASTNASLEQDRALESEEDDSNILLR